MVCHLKQPLIMFKKGAFIENKAAQQALSEGMDKLSVFAAQGGEPSHV